MDKFTQAYVEAALWSSMDEEGEPLDKNYGIEDIAPEALERMIADAREFQDVSWEVIERDLARAGHDFWLTRNFSGAGFGDGDWPEAAAEYLTKISHAFGVFDLYVGDDGFIYAMGQPRFGLRKRWGTR